MDSRLDAASNDRIIALKNVPVLSDPYAPFWKTVRAVDPATQIQTQETIARAGENLLGYTRRNRRGGSVAPLPNLPWVPIDRGYLVPLGESSRRSALPVTAPNRFTSDPTQRIIVPQFGQGRATRYDGREDNWVLR